MELGLKTLVFMAFPIFAIKYLKAVFITFYKCSGN